MDNNNQGCPMPLKDKAVNEVKSLAVGEVKSAIFWQLVSFVLFCWSSWHAIPVISNYIASQRPAGYGLFECHNKRGKLINTANLKDCRDKSEATFRQFEDNQNATK